MQPGGGEPRADARELERRAEEGLAQGHAAGGVVLGTARAVEAHRAQRAAAPHELGGEDAAVTREAALQVHLLHRHPERVAGLQLGVEVDVPLEDRGQVEGELVALTGLLDRAEQAGADPAGDRLGPRVVAARLDLCFEAVAVALDPQRPQLVDAVREGGEQAVRIEADVEGMADREPGQVVERPRGQDEVVDVGRIEARAEGPFQGGVARDRAADDPQGTLHGPRGRQRRKDGQREDRRGLVLHLEGETDRQQEQGEGGEQAQSSHGHNPLGIRPRINCRVVYGWRLRRQVLLELG